MLLRRVSIALALMASALFALADNIRGWHLSGSNPAGYSIVLDHKNSHTGTASALLFSRVSAPTGFGTLMQETLGEELKGKRVRYTAYVRTEGVEEYAGLWMRVDGAGDTPLAFDNMFDRPIKGDTAWGPYSIVLDVPAEASMVAFGVVLRGPGKVWLDTARFEVVTETEPTTALPPALTLPAMPVNLDFEQ